MSRMMKIVPLVVLCALIIAAPSVWACWVQDGVAICTATGGQGFPRITSDGAGGAIVTWYDHRSGKGDIYAQRVNASGAIQWAANGVILCTATVVQEYPKIISDGAGGAIVTWWDLRGSDIYAQRVNALGAVQWTANGVALCTATVVGIPAIVSDGAGGAIVTWEDLRNGSDYDIYAQRVNASGAVLWTANGVALCTATGDQHYPTIVSDSVGGAIVTWMDWRSSRFHIYAQRVNALGAVQWTTDGVAICTATGDQYYPMITSDGADGAIVTWEDLRNGSYYDIYAQRVNALGAVQWTTNGVALCTATGNQIYPEITSDGSSGAIVTWYDYRSGSNYDIYAQRVNASGDVQWTADGVSLCTATGDQIVPKMTSDGAGGAIVTWYDYRSGSNYDIFAQRVNASGGFQWTADGVPLCTATGDQADPTITSDGAGGAIVAWQDNRSGKSDIYVQRVCEGLAPVATLLASFSATVEESVVRVTWELSEPVTGLTFDVLRSSVGSETFEGVHVAIESHGKAYSFTDMQCTPGSILRYRVDVTESGVRRTLFETDAMVVPGGSLALFQNSPNPFNPTTTLRYYLPGPCEVTLSIHDASGRLVATLIDRERQEAGQHTRIWSGLDSRGRAIPSGVYFSMLVAGKERLSNKMLLLR